MKKHTTSLACAGIFILAGTAFSRMITPAYKQMWTAELRARTAKRDPEAVLALGLRNDTASVQLLKDVAAMPVPTDDELKKLLHVKSLPDPAVQMFVIDYQRRYWESSFAAKAALMRMRAGDYLPEFAIQLSTTNFDWKREVIDDLGYTGDLRALKYLGPLLSDDRTYATPGREHAFGRTISGAASDAMGQILHPPFMDVQRKHPEQYHVFKTEWRQWWKENKDKASDSTFAAQLGNTPPPAQSAEIKIQRQTLKKQSIEINDAAGGRLAANVSAIQLSVPTLRGEVQTVDVTMVLVPQNDLFWWEAHRDTKSGGSDRLKSFLETHKFYALQDKMIGFSMNGTNLIASEQGDRMKTFDDALRSIAPQIQSGVESSDSLPSGTQTVGLWTALRGFIMVGSKYSVPSVKAVTHQDSQWTVRLQNNSNNSAEVVLGADYKVIRASIEGSPVQLPK